MARDKNPVVSPKKVETLGVADGFNFNYSESDETPLEEKPVADLKVSNTVQEAQIIGTETGTNPYYNYHPKTGARGRALGAPRKESRRTQISIGCSEEDKQLYTEAAAADGRRLPDFINTAVKEYIRNHNLV